MQPSRVTMTDIILEIDGENYPVRAGISVAATLAERLVSWLSACEEGAELTEGDEDD